MHLSSIYRYLRGWRAPGVVLALVLTGALNQFGCRPGPQNLPPAIALKPGAAAGFNVVLVTLDTTRADRLGCYGYEAAETPNLDALATGGVRFADAVTCVPTTLPSHATILTGKYPPSCGVRDNGVYRLADGHETLAERLRAKGYATAAFLAAFVLDGRYGLDQGFDVYDDEITLHYHAPGVRRHTPQRPANVVVDSAIGWLDEHLSGNPDQPFFMWVHLFDPHKPYTPPEPYRTRFASQPYDGEVGFMDQELGRMIGRLRELDLVDHSVVVAVGDHGEGLGDHHEQTHGFLLYDSVMRVPFILYNPKIVPSGLVVGDRVVGTADVMPTLLDLLGEPVPSCDGVSLLRSVTRADRAVYLETITPRRSHGWSELYGLRTHVDKYIQAPTPEYYDLTVDPDELSNLFTSAAERGGDLRKRLEVLRASLPAEEAESVLQVDERAMRQLRALGYLSGSEADDTAGPGPRPDPKEMIAIWESRSGMAAALVDQGRFAEAVAYIQQLVEQMPNDGDLWSLLSLAQARTGRLEDAIASRVRSIELQPEDVSRWIYLAQLQRLAGNMRAMEAALDQAAAIEPDSGEIYLLRARQAIEAGGFERAIAFCEEARRRDPTCHTADSWSLQGSVYERMNNPAEARLAYQRALEADPRDDEALVGLAQFAQREADPARVVWLCEQIQRGEGQWEPSRALLARAYLSLGRGEEAVATIRSLVEAQPRQPSARSNLGNVLYQLGRYEEAATAYRQALELDPRYAVGHYNLGNALIRLGDPDAAAQHFQTALEINPRLHQAELGLARIDARRKRFEQSLGRLEQLLSSGAVTIEQIESEADFAPLLADPGFERLRTRFRPPSP